MNEGTKLVSSESGMTVIWLRVWEAGVRSKAQRTNPTLPLASLRGHLTSIPSTFFRQQHPDFPVMHQLIPILDPINLIWVDPTTPGSSGHVT